MLHLILGILKVIGILLLVLLSLILLGILALLFVPVRYELAGKVNEENAAVRGRITWLLRLVSVTAGWKDGRLQVRAKLLNFTVFSFGSGKEEKEASQEEPEEDSPEEGSPEKDNPIDDNPGQSYGEHGEIRKEEIVKENTEKSEIEENSKNTSEEIRPEEKAILPGGITESEAERVFLDCLEDSEEFQEPSEDEVIDETPKGFFKRIREIRNRIRCIPEQIRQRLELLQSLLKDGKGRLDSLAQTIQGWKERLQPFLAPEAKALYRRLLGHLKYIWKHYRPRKVQGWLRFGTGAPDLTGMLTGILYMILPPSAEEFELKPEFTEAILQTKMQLNGHIRAVHLLKTAICLWFDKEFRAMIRRVTAR